MLDHLPMNLEVKQVSDEGSFEGYASTYTIDRGMDVVAPGAFTACLDRYAEKGKLPKMLWQHDPGKVVGVWKSMKEDDKGLYVKGELIKETQLGKELHALMRRGAIDSMSIGYRTVDAEFEGDGRVRRLKELDLFEVSLVTFPMNPDAQVTDVKTLHSAADVERILRDAGVANKCAKLVARLGYNAAMAELNAQRQAGGEVAQSDLDRLFHALTSN